VFHDQIKTFEAVFRNVRLGEKSPLHQYLKIFRSKKIAHLFRAVRIRKRKNLGGTVSYLVDLSTATTRERKFFKTLEDAETFAGQRRIERANHGTASLALSDDLRREAIDLSEKLRLVGATLTDAVSFYFKHAKPDGGKKTVNEVIKELTTKRTASGRNADYLRVAGVLYNIFAKTFGERPIHTIMSKDIEEWLDSNSHWKPVTRLNYQRNLSVLWNFAVKHYYAAQNPLKRLERPTLDNKPPGILTPEQAKTLLGKAVEAKDDKVKAFVAIGLFAGLRVAEIERLDWSEIDFEGRLIEVTAAKAKTRQRRHVAMSNNLYAWLQTIAERSGPVITAEVRIDRFAEERAGIAHWPKNALRHSFASYHLAHNKDAAKTALEMGHNSQKLLFTNYRELVKPAQAAEFWAIVPA
jgi:integrase